MFQDTERDLRIFAIFMLSWMAFVAIAFSAAIFGIGRYFGVW